MKNSYKILFIALLACMASFQLQAQQYTEEVSLADSLSKEELFEKGKSFLNQLPQENGLSTKAPKGSADNGGLLVKRSFLVHKKQLSVLSHPVADVSYTAKIKIMEGGKYLYSFEDFKVYTYQRNRYGKYSRSNSRGQELSSLSGETQALVQKQLDEQVKQYIALLKMAMD